MPDEQPRKPPADGDDAVVDDERATGDPAPNPDPNQDRADGQPAAEPSGGRLFSVYGLASVVLGLVSVGAVVAGLITWSIHRSDKDERTHQSQVLQTAATWTSVLINLNAENVEKGMQRLRDKTVGELNSEFDAAVEPYREVVQRIQSRSSGRIEAVAIESVHHDLDGDAGARPSDSAEELPPSARTDTVMVVATSVAENVGGKPQAVHWALQLDVTDVDGRLLVSRMKSIR